MYPPCFRLTLRGCLPTPVLRTLATCLSLWLCLARGRWRRPFFTWRYTQLPGLPHSVVWPTCRKGLKRGSTCRTTRPWPTRTPYSLQSCPYVFSPWQEFLLRRGLSGSSICLGRRLTPAL